MLCSYDLINLVSVDERIGKMEVLSNCKEKIQEADIVLIGFGREFNVKREDILRNEDRYTLLKLDETQLTDLEKEWLELAIMYDCLNSGKCDIIEKRKTLYNKVSNYLSSMNKNNYFVVTTCFDDIITYSTFDKDRVVAPCGTLNLMKCDRGCFKHVYETQKVYENINGILNNYYKDGYVEQEKMFDELREAMPQCPMCKQVMSANIVKSNNYSEEGYREQWDSYMSWLQKTLNRKLVMLELGEGFETPTVIRWPFEKVAAVNNKATLIRVNEKVWQISEDIEAKAIPLNMSGVAFIEEIVE